MDLIDIIEELRKVAEVDMAIPRNPKVYLVSRNPFEIYTDMQFKKKYRPTKEVAQFVMNLVRNEISYVNNNPAEHHLNNSALSIVVKRAVKAIAGHGAEFIKFPENDKLNTVKAEFYNIARCPAIVRATDGTHVKIKCPGGENPDLFINRKNYY
ncbi:hypothetical protein NQ314_019863 [Rhamnusium bicolor]|uniref:Ribosomal protein S7 n=1 Tax=Rhamnusium bicolor TaxID=1586634 RepID=A0AAV8WNA3_9CUCU|nr:hypothetical protein NQ314_019863 [Rhamnusium bicolor]